jgi:bloom syndrome protein
LHVALLIRSFKVGRNARQYTENRRSLIMDIRVASPDSKSKKRQTKPNAKKSSVGQTGVVAAGADPLLSTYVSSPVQAASKRRRRVFDQDEDDESAVLLNNSYYGDSFVVDDDGDDDGFEPVRGASKARATKKRELGPPITGDEAMESLTPRRRMIVTNFVISAKSKGKAIMTANNLRSQPFTDTILRQIILGFVTTKDEMLRIAGVRSEMVDLHGKHFLEMSKASRDLYQEMKRREEEEERPHDPNHKNVIDLVSDDEETDYGDDFDLNDDEVEDDGCDEEDEEEVHSGYFQAPQKSADVIAFNNKLKGVTQNEPAAPTKSARASKKSLGRSGWKKGPKKSRARRKSAGSGNGPVRNGAPKRAGTGTGGGGRAGDIFGGGGIAAMPV